MFVSCKNHLVDVLKRSGIKTTIFTSMKKLKASSESHVGAVLFSGGVVERSGEKKVYIDGSGLKKKRTKLFTRELNFEVVIGEYDQDKAEELYHAFLKLIGQGILEDGNYIAIEISEEDWVDESDSILKSKIAVQVKIKFIGGVYQDTGFTKVNAIDTSSIGGV